MKSTSVALISAVALLSSHFLGAQAPPQSGLIRDVAAGQLVLVARADGSVIGWGQDPNGRGANDEGQLGNGAKGADGVLGIYPKPSVTPVRVTGLADIIEIEAGRKHALALGKDGTVWALGTREDGALGVGTRVTGWTPAEVTGLDRVVGIAAGNGGSHGVSGAVRDDGTVWVWGSNASAMMGNGQGPTAPDDPGGRNPLPVQVKGIVGAKRLSIGGGHVSALLGDGSLRMWGHNGYGEIGIGTSGPYEPKPVKVTGITNVAAVYLGSMRSYAVRADGTFWIWGFGYYPAQGLLAKNLHVPTLLDLR
jgi:alpha-tubulin suppressor-like RCC1 family protein